MGALLEKKCCSLIKDFQEGVVGVLREIKTWRGVNSDRQMAVDKCCREKGTPINRWQLRQMRYCECEVMKCVQANSDEFFILT